MENVVLFTCMYVWGIATIALVSLAVRRRNGYGSYISRDDIVVLSLVSVFFWWLWIVALAALPLIRIYFSRQEM